MAKHTFDIKVTVTDEQIEDIMSSALAGCTYWADDCVLNSKSPFEKDLMMSQAITHGCKLKIHDAEEDKWHVVSLTSFLKALAKTPMFDYEDYDMYAAEQVLQKAIFKKVVYA